MACCVMPSCLNVTKPGKEYIHIFTYIARMLTDEDGKTVNSLVCLGWNKMVKLYSFGSEKLYIFKAEASCN